MPSAQSDMLKKRKVQMLEETREALVEVEAGNLIAGDKVLDWLDSWGDKNEKPSPV